MPSQAVCNRWTGPLDSTTGLDYWTDLSTHPRAIAIVQSRNSSGCYMSVRETSCTAAAWLHSTGNMVACSSVGITDCHRGLYNNYSLCRAKRRHRCTDLHHVHRLVFITTRPFLCCYIKPTSSNIITSQTRTFIIVRSPTLILMKHWYYSDETDETGTKYQKTSPGAVVV